MKKLILLMIVLLVCGVWVVAQTSTQSSSQSSTSSQSPASSQSSASSQNPTSSESQMSGSKETVRGCLSGSEGNYTLTSDSGEKYQLSGETSKLNAHVGHEIEVTGTTSASTPSSTGSSGSSMSGSGSEPTLNVQHFKHISTSCKSGSGGEMKH